MDNVLLHHGRSPKEWVDAVDRLAIEVAQALLGVGSVEQRNSIDRARERWIER